jgi:SAM-dependent methyltransferase
MKLYDELGEWYPTFSSAEEYRQEAAFFERVLRNATKPRPHTLLELGSGVGNNASYLKKRFTMTLVDRSTQMLAASRARNPELEHIVGDIRTIRLGRVFDAVFVHDAIAHMTTEAELRTVMETAFIHCRPGGVAIFVPDFVRETFVEGTDHGGNDSERGGVRYVQWTTDPDPTDNTFIVDFGILIRDKNGAIRVVHDQHLYGLFPRSTWLRLLREVGFKANVERDEYVRDLFRGRRPELPHANRTSSRRLTPIK